MAICYSSLRKWIQSWSRLFLWVIFPAWSHKSIPKQITGREWIRTTGLDQFVVKLIVGAQPQLSLLSLLLRLPATLTFNHLKFYRLWFENILCACLSFILYFIFWLPKAFTWFNKQNYYKTKTYTQKFPSHNVLFIPFTNHHLTVGNHFY